MSFDNWTDGLTEICSGFQLDLSCLVDGELDQAAAARAMLHIEECPSCCDFLADTRRQVRLHRDMADPDRLLARVAMLTGLDLDTDEAGLSLADRLASIFYQLGKAYTLAAIDLDSLRLHVFQATLPVELTKVRGRGFVDGVVAGHRDHGSSVDWQRARHLLNGRLERIADPLEKGRKLLQEVLDIDPAHEEARLYMARLLEHEGKRLEAAERFREVFDTALDPENRVHAAINLGQLYFKEANRPKALLFWRWVLVSGLVQEDERFWSVYFNIGMAYAYECDQERSLAYFRALLDRFPERAVGVARAFANSPRLRRQIDIQEGFTEAFLRRCPELFQPSDLED
jgi:tetratricopeptide (TPR) repeat protein